jgi:predicted nucleotidyltransferase
MDARPSLERVARSLANQQLDAVLIGNAAAALRGAPVTTLDFDFMFRETPVNLRKLKAVARELGAVVFRPYYPVSRLYRVVDEDRGLQVDFMPALHGIRKFESLRSRSTEVEFGEAKLRVASLADVIKSKRAAGSRDIAVLPILEATLRESEERADP